MATWTDMLGSAREEAANATAARNVAAYDRDGEEAENIADAVLAFAEEADRAVVRPLVAALWEATRVVRTEREQAEREGTSDALEEAVTLRAVEEQADTALKLAGAG